jgi:hypothetical protein
MPAVPKGCRVWKELDWDVMEPPRKRASSPMPQARRNRSPRPTKNSAKPSAASPGSSPPAADGPRQLQ